MKTFLYRLAQWTWGFPQTLIGFVLFLIYRKKEHKYYHGAIVIRWHGSGSVALGMFILLSDQVPFPQPLLVHEYGHTMQSLILGPLFLLFVGIPSLLWAGLPFLQVRRQKRHISYYAFYTERWANCLGEWITKSSSPR